MLRRLNAVGVPRTGDAPVTSGGARSRRSAPQARAFTLVEALILIAAVIALLAIALPLILSTRVQVQARTLAASVSMVRNTIVAHAGEPGVPQSPGGFPMRIDSDWFPMLRLPDHAWTGEPFAVEMKLESVGTVYPEVKSFRLGSRTPNAWYNARNGSFAARVPPQRTAAQTLALFNMVNQETVTSLDQTGGEPRSLTAATR